MNLLNESMGWLIEMVGLSMDIVDAKIILLLLTILFSKFFKNRA